MTEIIDLTICPYCQKVYINELEDEVCPDCIPLLACDYAVADITNTLSNLEKMDKKILKGRINGLRNANNKLYDLIMDIGETDDRKRKSRERDQNTQTEIERDEEESPNSSQSDEGRPSYTSNR